MVGETDLQCSLVELDGCVQVRQHIRQHASVLKTAGEVGERHESIRMARLTKRQCSPMELNGLIQVTLDAPLMESELEGKGKVIERIGSKRMGSGTAC
jgi:hypothetical protein